MRVRSTECKWIAVAPLLVLMGAGTAAAQTLVNGSFESSSETCFSGATLFTFEAGSGSLSSWRIESGSVDWICHLDYWPAPTPDGARSLDLSGDSDGKIAQDIATVPGKTYVVNFWMGANIAAPCLKTIEVTAGASSQQFTFNYCEEGNIWTEKEFAFVATEANTTLAFESLTGSAKGPALDHVSVAEAGTQTIVIRHDGSWRSINSLGLTTDPGSCPGVVGDPGPSWTTVGYEAPENEIWSDACVGTPGHYYCGWSWPNFIWHDCDLTWPMADASNDETFYRRAFYIDGAPCGQATVDLCVDDNLQLYVNGILVFEDLDGGAGNYPNVDITDALQAGDNVFAIHAWDGGSGCSIYPRGNRSLAVRATIEVGYDMDSDGYCAVVDCSELDPAINPGALELPGNFVDENCDGNLGDCDPCADWRNHGMYVRCVAQAVEELVLGGWLGEDEGDALVVSAAQSDVGKKNFIPEECLEP